ncbi:hypothetical protein AbraIFM66950_007699, partial [Aspergillus brasiliensis]
MEFSKSTLPDAVCHVDNTAKKLIVFEHLFDARILWTGDVEDDVGNSRIVPGRTGGRGGQVPGTGGPNVSLGGGAGGYGLRESGWYVDGEHAAGGVGGDIGE